MAGKGKHWDIVYAFGECLEKKLCTCGRLADLPADKVAISEAILKCLEEPVPKKIEDALGVALMEVDNFISDSEFEIALKYERAMRDVNTFAALPTETCDEYEAIQLRIERSKEN